MTKPNESCILETLAIGDRKIPVILINKSERAAARSFNFGASARHHQNPGKVHYQVGATIKLLRV